MKEFFAFPLALLIAAPSEPVPTGPGTENFAGMPPQRFMREEAVVVAFVADVTEYCGGAAPGLTMIACTRLVEGSPVVFMPHPAAFGDEFYGRIMTHELAHVAGWPKEHPE